MAKCHVVALSHDANGNIIGMVHMNPILDTRMYLDEFSGGKATELTANVIAETMYVKCDADRNEYLLLDSLVDYNKDNKAIFLTQQETCLWGRPVTIRPLQAGKFAASRRMVLSHGRSCPS